MALFDSSKRLESRIRELKRDRAKAKSERDRQRAKRLKFEARLELAHRAFDVVNADHFSRWSKTAGDLYDLVLPDIRLVEHIAYRADVETPEPTLQFLHTGYLIMLELRMLLLEHYPEIASRASTVLDFGCGCARVSRFLKELIPGKKLDVFGCDIDREAIEWDNAALEKSGTYFVSPDRPPLPPTDGDEGGYDIILALSVFTHLPEDMQREWLSELSSRLKPGGTVVATFHGVNHQNALEESARTRLEQEGFVHINLGATPDLPDYYLSSFQTEDYIRREWSKHLDIVAIDQVGLNGQAMAMLSKPETHGS